MASVTCTNCGATLKTANPIAPGKKVKCPKCKEVFVVEDEEEPEEEEQAEDEGAEDEEEEAPAPKKKPSKPLPQDDEEDEEEEEEEEPAPKKKPGKPLPQDDEEDEEEEEEEEEPAPRKKPGKPAKDEDEDEDEEDEDEDEKPKKGKKKDDKKKGGSMMLIIIIGVVLLLCCGGCGITGWMMEPTIMGWFGKDTPIPKKGDGGVVQKQEQKLDDGKPVFTGTAEALTKEFLDDEAKAIAKYKDKIVEVTGEIWVADEPTKFTLKGAKKDAKDQLGVSLVCDLKAGEQPKVKIEKGKTVKIVGKVIRAIGPAVQVSECTVSEPAKLLRLDNPRPDVRLAAIAEKRVWRAN